ncbi:MAG: hypothetical protein HY696_12710 [Deltaproteobacteria bacterium]|nr:hypothetical protein [Deltaproteobacteria bacterium]
MSQLRIETPRSGHELLLKAAAGYDAKGSRGTVNTKASAQLALLQKGSAGFAQSGHAVDSTNILSRQEADRFISQNRDLLYVIDNDASGKAKERLEKTAIATRENLINVVAETAHALLTPTAANVVTVKKLEQRPQLAAMLVLNTAGIRNLVNHDDAVRALFADDAPLPDQAMYERVGEMAADLFESGSTLDDAEFFKAHPKAAVYLLGNSDVVRDMSVPAYATSRQLTFYNAVDSDPYQDLFDNNVSQVAADATQSGVFNQSFFATEDYVPFAEFVAAGQFIKDVPTPGETLHNHPEYRLQNVGRNDRFNYSDVVKGIVAMQARDLLAADLPVKADFFRSELEVAQIALARADFRANLQSESARADLSALSGSGVRPTVSAATLSALRQQFRSSYRDPPNRISIMV